MREDAAHPQPAGSLQFGGPSERGGRLGRGEPVAAESGVELQLHDRARPARPLELAERADAEVDAGGDGGAKSVSLAVEPGEDRGVDAGRAQGERLIQVGDAEPVGPRLDRRPRDGSAPCP